MEPGEMSTTVAVKVTDWPDTDGLDEETTAVVVLAGVIVWPPPSVPVLAEKFPSAGTKIACTVCGDPTTDNVAVPGLVAVLLLGLAPDRGTGAPKLTPSTTNCTAP